MLCPSLLEESKSIQESKVDIALFDKPVVNVCDLLCIVLVQLGHPHAENLRLKKMTICDRKSYVIRGIFTKIFNVIMLYSLMAIVNFTFGRRLFLNVKLCNKDLSLHIVLYKCTIRCLD